MEIIQPNALISINATLVVMLVSFLVFLFVFNRVMIRPVRETIARRETEIVHLKREAQHLTQKAQTLMIEMQAGERKVRREAHEIRLAHRQEGQSQAKETLRQARQEIDRLRQEGQTQLAHKIEGVRAQLDAEAQGLAEMIVSRVLDGRVSG